MEMPAEQASEQLGLMIRMRLMAQVFRSWRLGSRAALFPGLQAAGLQVDGNLFVSNRAQVVLPSHRLMEKLSEARPGRGVPGGSGT